MPNVADGTAPLPPPPRFSVTIRACYGSIRHFSWRSTATAGHANRARSTSSFILSLSPLPFRFRPHLARHVIETHTYVQTRRARDTPPRIYLPISWVHRRSLSWDTRRRSRVTIPPLRQQQGVPFSSSSAFRAQVGTSMFTGAACPRDTITLRDAPQHYRRLHPANDTALRVICRNFIAWARQSAFHERKRIYAYRRYVYIS